MPSSGVSQRDSSAHVAFGVTTVARSSSGRNEISQRRWFFGPITIVQGRSGSQYWTLVTGSFARPCSLTRTSTTSHGSSKPRSSSSMCANDAHGARRAIAADRIAGAHRSFETVPVDEPQGHAVRVLAHRAERQAELDAGAGLRGDMLAQRAFDRRLREHHRRDVSERIRRLDHRHALDQLAVDAEELRWRERLDMWTDGIEQSELLEHPHDLVVDRDGAWLAVDLGLPVTDVDRKAGLREQRCRDGSGRPEADDRDVEDPVHVRSSRAHDGSRLAASAGVDDLVANRVRERADTVNLDLVAVPRLQPKRWRASLSDAGRRAHRDHVAGLEGQHLGQQRERLGDAEDHVAGARVLHHRTVEPALDAQAGRAGRQFVGSDEHGSEGACRIEVLADGPLRRALLIVTHRQVVEA